MALVLKHIAAQIQKESLHAGSLARCQKLSRHSRLYFVLIFWKSFALVLRCEINFVLYIRWDILRCNSLECENRQHAFLLQHNTVAHFWVLNVNISCIWLSLNNLPRGALAVPSRGRGDITLCCDTGLAAEEKLEEAAPLIHMLSIWDLSSLDYTFFWSLHFWAKLLRWLWHSK